MISGIERAATICCAEAAVAMVVKPAPARIAALPQSAAAPVMPREPAMMSAWPCVFLYESGT